VNDRNAPKSARGALKASCRAPQGRHERDHASHRQIQDTLLAQEPFVKEGYDGHPDKTRPSRIPPLGADVAEKIVVLTVQDPPSAVHSYHANRRMRYGISFTQLRQHDEGDPPAVLIVVSHRSRRRSRSEAACDC
jgi:hypothetical protein